MSYLGRRQSSSDSVRRQSTTDSDEVANYILEQIDEDWDYHINDVSLNLSQTWFFTVQAE